MKIIMRSEKQIDAQKLIRTHASFKIVKTNIIVKDKVSLT